MFDWGFLWNLGLELWGIDNTYIYIYLSIQNGYLYIDLHFYTTEIYFYISVSNLSEKNIAKTRIAYKRVIILKQHFVQVF